MAGINKIFILNNKGTLLSTYAKNETLVLSSLKSDIINDLKKLNLQANKENGTFLSKCLSHTQVGEQTHELKLTVTNECDVNNMQINDMSITFLDIDSNTDIIFVNQLSNLMNMRFFVIDQLSVVDNVNVSYNNGHGLLSLQGFIIDCEIVPIDYYGYLNSIFDL